MTKLNIDEYFMNDESENRVLGSLSSLTSATLLSQVKLKDEAAWRDLSQLYEPLIRSWCRKANVPPTDIDDIVQEVFRSVLAAIPNFVQTKAAGSFRSWLWTIVRNKIRDHFKVLANKAVSAGGTDAYLSLQQLPEAEPLQPESESNGETDVIRQALTIIQGEVKEHTFRAFWRSTVDGIAPDMVASELGITVDSVYQAKARILRRLRDLLD